MSYLRRKLWGGADPYIGLEKPKEELPLQGFQLRCPVLAEEVIRAKPKYILEIGAHRGASICWMAENAPHAELLSVDPWVLNEFCFKAADRIIRYGTARDYFRACVLSRNLENRVTYLPMLSNEAFEVMKQKIPDVRFGVAYIDGGHSYKQCLSDMENARLITDGPIIVDDYEADRFPGVYRSVNEFALKYDLQITKGNRKAILKARQ